MAASRPIPPSGWRSSRSVPRGEPRRRPASGRSTPRPRITSGSPTTTCSRASATARASRAEADLGGWYSSDVFHVFGQILSGLARLHAATGDPACREKAEALLAGWAECVEPDGYFYYSRKPNAPHYIYDKMVGGLTDMVLFCDSKLAAESLAKITGWAVKNLDRSNPYACGGTEWYTLSENLYRAHRATGDPRPRLRRGLALRRILGHLRAQGRPLRRPRQRPADRRLSRVQPRQHPRRRGPGLSPHRRSPLPRHDPLRPRQAAGPAVLSHRRIRARRAAPAPHDWQEGRLLAQLVRDAVRLLRRLQAMQVPAHDHRRGPVRRLDRAPGVQRHRGDDPDVARRPRLLLLGLQRPGRREAQPPGRLVVLHGTRPMALADLHDLVYFRRDEDLYVNLYVPSTVAWSRPGGSVVVRQLTRFPESDSTAGRALPSQRRRRRAEAPRARLAGRPDGGRGQWRAGRLTVDSQAGRRPPRWRDGDRVRCGCRRSSRSGRSTSVALAGDDPARAGGDGGPLDGPHPGDLLREPDLERSLVASAGEPLTYRPRSGAELLVRPFYAFKQGERYSLYLDPNRHSHEARFTGTAGGGRKPSASTTSPATRPRSRSAGRASAGSASASTTPASPRSASTTGRSSGLTSTPLAATGRSNGDRTAARGRSPDDDHGNRYETNGLQGPIHQHCRIRSEAVMPEPHRSSRAMISSPLVARASCPWRSPTAWKAVPRGPSSPRHVSRPS